MPTRIVRLWLPCVSLLFLFVQVGAVDLDQCRAGFANETGQPNPTNITYHQCVETCGGGAGNFNWPMFSQGFGAWFLPWIALIFQLPFGATDRMDNIVSILLAIGSPALAGYSLAMTRLNGRWLSRQFLYLNFPNKDHIPLAVSALQHIPFKIYTSGSPLPSEIAQGRNDKYWEGLAKAAKRTRQWSIPMAMNILWVLAAFGLTIVDSFVDFANFITLPGDAGYSVGAVWTWLLPLVVGWLHVGSQPDPDYLRSALENANESATNRPAMGVAGYEIEPFAGQIDHVNADEKKTAPIFNYSRVFIWSQNAERILNFYRNPTAGADRKNNRTGTEAEVDEPNAISHDSIDGTPQFPIPLIPYSPSLPSPGPSATAPPTAGMYTNAPAFAHRRSTTTTSKYEEEALPMELPATPKKPVFATEVFHRVFFALVLTLILQWGTTGAALLIQLNTPPKGMGCRALTFTVYGAASTAAFLLLLLSSILAHLARRQGLREMRSGLKNLVGCIAVFTRWLGKLIAILNGFGILLSCTAQFAGVYDSCFCTSNILGGNRDGLVSFVQNDIRGSQVYSYWIGGTIVAFGVSGLYTFAIYATTPME